jgi:tellurite resistance protein TehA-like permease
MLLTGFAIFWMFIAYYALVSGFLRRQIKPSLFWWSSIFPVATVVTALTGLGFAMDSTAFRICACILFVALVLIYIANSIMTVTMTLSGKFLGLEHGFHHEYSRLQKLLSKGTSQGAKF